MVASAQADESGGSGGTGVFPETEPAPEPEPEPAPEPEPEPAPEPEREPISEPIIVPPPSTDDGSTSVPEPTSVLALLALGGIAASLRKSRKR